VGNTPYKTAGDADSLPAMNAVLPIMSCAHSLAVADSTSIARRVEAAASVWFCPTASRLVGRAFSR